MASLSPLLTRESSESTLPLLKINELGRQEAGTGNVIYLPPVYASSYNVNYNAVNCIAIA